MEEEIPACYWELWIDAGEHAKKVCFEGTDHALSNVALVHSRRYLLVFAFSFVGDAVDVGGTGLIIQDVEVEREATCLHAFHDGIVRGYSVCIGLGFEGLNHDSVGANVMCQHDVAVATARFNW